MHVLSCGQLTRYRARAHHEYIHKLLLKSEMSDNYFIRLKHVIISACPAWLLAVVSARARVGETFRFQCPTAVLLMHVSSGVSLENVYYDSTDTSDAAGT